MSETGEGWTVDTALIHLEQKLAFALRALDERYLTQTKALDAALVAQQTAMQTAFTAADRAVQAALESAEKAVTKAEIAAEKRFEAVNEFRGQLADQAARLMPRTESDVRFNAVAEKLDIETKWTGERFANVFAQLDTNKGRDTGQHDGQARLYATIGAVGGCLGIALSFVALIAVFRQ